MQLEMLADDIQEEKHMDGNYSLADVAAATRGDDGLFGGGSWVIVILLFLMLAGGGWGSRGQYGPDPTTLQAINSGFANQTGSDILMSSANNNYETAQLINGQTTAMMGQAQTALVNSIQGFNQLTNTITTQGMGIQSSISDLSHHMDDCCCSIKTLILQNRLEDAQAKVVAQRSQIDNAQQSQYLLSQLGKFVPTTADAA